MNDFIDRFKDLDAAFVPGFRALQSCDKFYSRVLDLLASANEVHIASLFFGEDGRMAQILDVLEERKRRGLHTVILVDKSRGTAASSLAFAKKRGLESMFRLVDLTTHWTLSSKLNQMLRVFHTKALVFDSTVLISGANMDSAYMCNRQDRYVRVLI